mmetsp:Transcript_34737/g.104698  ORF Transcript_34737/g.104698 Transcript_34737/m.104698 type:complete len:475 (-) Transcript_34737:133-1557(-)
MLQQRPCSVALAALAVLPATTPARSPPATIAFQRRSAYTNLSAALERAGGCLGQRRPTKSGGLDAGDLVAVRLACALGCEVHEPVLEEAFEAWWDHSLPSAAVFDACKLAGRQHAQMFIAAISRHRVLYRCCSRRGREDCEPGDIQLGSGRVFTGLQLLLTLVAEIAVEAGLPDMLFVFSSGDQPALDRVWWSPVPQFQWVRSRGHWTVPLPSPFQLRAHFLDQLGDGVAHMEHQVQWREKARKVFWRGPLSGPDNIVFQDIDTMPCVRLMRIAAQHPELFDVAITGADGIVYERLARSQVESLLLQLPQGEPANMAEALPRFRYVINVSAVLSAWRLVEMLTSGSLLLLQEDSSWELIREWLTPWEHFVPVSMGLSDLVPKVQWLEAHPGEAEAIARRGLQRFQQRIRRQDTYCYLLQAMRALARATELPRLAAPEALRAEGWAEVEPSAVASALAEHVPLEQLAAASRGAEL